MDKLLCAGNEPSKIREVITMNAKKSVPIWEKKLLTIEECTAYTGIGIGKIKAMTQEEGCSFTIWIGANKMIVRDKLDEYLENSYSI